MKQFNKYGVALAVSAVATSAVATVKSDQNLGDAAIIPYYTTTAGKNTGVHIVNTTAATQVVKFRLRRGADSRDAMDFNIIMSPQDEWTGSIQADDAAGVKIVTGDNTCTAPQFNNGVALMPSTYAEGAGEGYIEIIGMGQPTAETAPLAVNAEHDATGVPADCDAVADNFFRVADGDYNTPAVKGVHDSDTTSDAHTTTASALTEYSETPDQALKVSWFIRDADGGLEVGGNANHIEGFATLPMMTNQQALQFAATTGEVFYDPFNFEYPNLNAGAMPSGTRTTNHTSDTSTLYNDLRLAMGSDAIINEWSDKSVADATVNTDWVVTLPGQYLMEDPFCVIYESYSDGAAGTCTATATVADTELPLLLVNVNTPQITIYDREEDVLVAEQSDDSALSFSPGGEPGVDNTDVLDREVNVLVWSQDLTSTGVLESAAEQSESDFGLRKVIKAAGGEDLNGWAKLTINPRNTGSFFQVVGSDTVNDSTDDTVAPAAAPGGQTYGDFTGVLTGDTLVLGMSVWQRNFGSNAAANYGRAVEHSYDYGSTGSVLPNADLVGP